MRRTTLIVDRRVLGRAARRWARCSRACPQRARPRDRRRAAPPARVATAACSRRCSSATSARPVVEAGDKEPIERGHVYVAPPDYHLLVERGRFALSVDARVQYARPSIDVLFESVADVVRASVRSGSCSRARTRTAPPGSRAIKRRGGVAIVQDPRDGGAADDARRRARRRPRPTPCCRSRRSGRFLYGLCVPSRGGER